jgi:hypothetical protein
MRIERLLGAVCVVAMAVAVSACSSKEYGQRSRPIVRGPADSPAYATQGQAMAAAEDMSGEAAMEGEAVE